MDDIIVHCCDSNMYAFDIDNFLIIDKDHKPILFKDAKRDPIEDFRYYFVYD